MSKEKRFNRHCAVFDPHKINKYGFTVTESSTGTGLLSLNPAQVLVEYHMF